MRKLGIFFVAILLLAAFVLAEGPQAGNNKIETGLNAGVSSQIANETAELQTAAEIQNQGNATQIRAEERVRAGNYQLESGEQVEVQEGEKGLIMSARNVEANSQLNLSQNTTGNKTRFTVHLSNGLNAEVKIMPDAASERAIEVLKAKCEINNCTIELKEVGSGNQSRAAYEMKVEKKVRVLGLFQAKIQESAQIDAENGNVIKVRRPWWAFLAVG
ncbi:hypothetical protein COV21_00420 [Candidatus Woesearchaeota archaeon CG10_big_fil_rev_8_21_14_0_10_45_5]|nr:MAG: hypothetical protein COV21_00420 [Candidatus Woesearchaeota archaeon CG10_big_fil_rev_8_21_14_0_10_45_5]PIU29720.1 MAG: hypothetical protein COT07_04490 [Candidatus Woesearchaeota archaeon CG07_land_8_20_14_0_80_44_23]